MEKLCVSNIANIMYEFPDEDSLRIKTRINALCHLLN